jgi:hypothetical protein
MRVYDQNEGSAGHEIGLEGYGYHGTSSGSYYVTYVVGITYSGGEAGEVGWWTVRMGVGPGVSSLGVWTSARGVRATYAGLGASVLGVGLQGSFRHLHLLPASAHAIRMDPELGFFRECFAHGSYVTYLRLKPETLPESKVSKRNKRKLCLRFLHGILEILGSVPHLKR